MTQMAVTIPADTSWENVPTIGVAIAVPVAGGSDWWELGEVVATVKVEDGIEVVIELATGLSDARVFGGAAG